ncbi:signal peptidase II [Cohnella lubricantis]|uniref:Lipoprotein signal peptidase n=1 Tax=Cohnella lubricantis TaxID=2163172 RepID=A0A841TE91_9BACL|nr:signal peptidase II [Cohnella lubricantis]MBB6677297.1 signal peptidase II [Cohnella lubricantis]MBP2116891.1 signal peptidase II [Cohnella lubricantis]
MQRRQPGIWIYYLTAIVVFAIDYFTKMWIKNSVDLYEQIKVIGNFFVITSIRNRGAAWSMLQDQRVLFILITIVVAAAIIWYMNRTHPKGKMLLMFALSLVLGGALGNFLDRAVYGEVVDFLQFTFGSYIYPIFNIADCAICIGVGLIILDSILTSSKEKKGSHEHGEQSEEEHTPVS